MNNSEFRDALKSEIVSWQDGWQNEVEEHGGLMLTFHDITRNTCRSLTAALREFGIERDLVEIEKVELQRNVTLEVIWDRFEAQEQAPCALHVKDFVLPFLRKVWHSICDTSPLLRTGFVKVTTKHATKKTGAKRERKADDVL